MKDYCFPEKGKSALLTISAQRDFSRADSPICAKGIERALPAMQRLVESFRKQSAPIFHSVRLYRPDGSNVEPCRRSAVEEGLRIFMPGSFGAELIDALNPNPEVRLNPEKLLNGGLQELATSHLQSARTSEEAKKPRRRISEVIADIVADAPPEELAKLPRDGASQVDHYVYGLSPKSERQQAWRRSVQTTAGRSMIPPSRGTIRGNWPRPMNSLRDAISCSSEEFRTRCVASWC